MLGSGGPAVTSPFTLADAECDFNSAGLESTDHPVSDKTLAWVHEYGKARVFNYQSGHDARVWANEGFKRLTARAVHWTA